MSVFTNAQKSSTARSQRGTSLMEVLTGALFFIPIALLFIDLGSLTMIEQLNDHLAKDAARAAANQLDETRAKEAALKTVKMFPLSSLVTSVDLKCIYKDGSVSTTVTMDARVPAPFPGLGSKKLIAASFQPVVGTPADL
jgi:Flp pilus assembly protein TadG